MEWAWKQAGEAHCTIEAFDDARAYDRSSHEGEGGDKETTGMLRQDHRQIATSKTSQEIRRARNSHREQLRAKQMAVGQEVDDIPERLYGIMRLGGKDRAMSRSV